MLEANSKIEFKNKSSAGTLIGVVLIFIAVAIYVFLLKPLAVELSTLTAELSENTEKSNSFKLQIADFESAKNELDLSTAVQRRESLKAVPVGMNQDELIRSLLDMSDKNGILLHSISFSKGANNREGIGSLRVSASFEGNYKDLTDFMRALEINERIFKVDSINVQISTLDLVDIQRANFSLNIETFYQQ